jgi:ornithine cyclodeaminase
MLILEWDQLQNRLMDPEVIDLMRDALIAQARGQCETPLPMHLDITPAEAEVHMKSSYRRGGKYYALKVASSFPKNREHGASVGNGMIMLFSAETGEPVAILNDGGRLTDIRTAAVSAMVARALGRTDTVLGIVGSGIQARMQARFHAAVLPLLEVVIWGRNPDHVAECARDIEQYAPCHAVATPAEVTTRAKLIVTCTSSREPLLRMQNVWPGMHVSAVGSDATGKQELEPAILRSASLLLVDSRQQSSLLGELQHAPSAAERAVEIGAWLESPQPASGISVCDFTGLGVEDLYIAEYCYENRTV